MIYRIYLSLYFVSFVLTQTFPILGTDETLDVMTWNVENFPKHNSTINYLEDIITDIKIDVIALQEIASQNDFNQLVDNLDSGWAGYRYSTSNYGELAFLINTNNIDILQSPYSILNQYEHYFAYRPPYVLKISFNNEEFIIINVHYKCCGDGDLDNDYWDEEYRRLQANQVLKNYIDLNFSQKNVIVLGDFNDDISEGINNNIFIDIINDYNNFLFTDIDISNGSTSNWSFPNWPSHLDHILVTNELYDNFNNDLIYTFRVDDYMNSWGQYDNYISDHRPVVINFIFSLSGDLNQDNNINILDVTILINFILNDIFNSNADLNGDDGLNIIDLVLLVDLILNL